MKSIACFALLLLGTFFVAQSQNILKYQVDNGSTNNFWEVEIYPGYPAVSAIVNPMSTIKGIVDIKSMPITWVATKANGCVANGTISGAIPWTAVTVTCPPGQTGQAYHTASGPFPWPPNTSLSYLDMKIKLN